MMGLCSILLLPSLRCAIKCKKKYGLKAKAQNLNFTKREIVFYRNLQTYFRTPSQSGTCSVLLRRARASFSRLEGIAVIGVGSVSWRVPSSHMSVLWGPFPQGHWEEQSPADQRTRGRERGPQHLERGATCHTVIACANKNAKNRRGTSAPFFVWM